jgi:hypothetical protein
MVYRGGVVTVVAEEATNRGVPVFSISKPRDATLNLNICAQKLFYTEI